MINPADFDSYSALAKATLKASKQISKELAQKLLFRLVAADVAGRKEQQHYLSARRMNLAAAPQFWQALVSFIGKLTVTASQLAAIESKYKRLVFGTKTLMGLDDALQFVILERARELIEGAMEGDVSFYDFKNEMQDMEYLPEYRLQLIFTQNILQAYNAGAWQQLYQEMPSDEYLVFDTAHDERVDDLCAEFDNFVALKSDPRWEPLWPPLHFNCRCTVRMALKEDMATARYDVDTSLVPEDFQTWPADGFTLTTPSQQELENAINSIKDI